MTLYNFLRKKVFRNFSFEKIFESLFVKKLSWKIVSPKIKMHFFRRTSSEIIFSINFTQKTLHQIFREIFFAFSNYFSWNLFFRKSFSKIFTKYLFSWKWFFELTAIIYIQYGIAQERVLHIVLGRRGYLAWFLINKNSTFLGLCP